MRTGREYVIRKINEVLRRKRGGGVGKEISDSNSKRPRY